MSQAGTAGLPSPGTVPARAPRTASCHKVPRARAKRAVDPAERHGQARGRADSEIVHLAALGALQGPAESGKVPGRHPPGARRQILAGQVTDGHREHDLGHEHHLARHGRPAGGVTLALHAPALGFAIWPSSAQ